MAEAIKVAEYFIKSLPLDNLKLQKLFYYSQAVHLVLHDKTPLVPEVYHEYKSFGFDIIPGFNEPSPLPLEELNSADLVIAAFGRMSGSELINQTHHEAPWRNAYRPGRPSSIISLDSMYGYFKERLDVISSGK
jgi:uncharacterized phage-associated protein